MYVVPRSAVRPDTTLRLRVRYVHNELWSEWSPTLRLGERPTPRAPRTDISRGPPARLLFGVLPGHLPLRPGRAHLGPRTSPLLRWSCSHKVPLPHFGVRAHASFQGCFERTGAPPSGGGSGQALLALCRNTPPSVCPAAVRPLPSSCGHPRRATPRMNHRALAPVSYCSLSPAQVLESPRCRPCPNPAVSPSPEGSARARGGSARPAGCPITPLLYGVSEEYPRACGLHRDCSHHAVALAAGNGNAALAALWGPGGRVRGCPSPGLSAYFLVGVAETPLYRSLWGHPSRSPTHPFWGAPGQELKVCSSWMPSPRGPPDASVGLLLSREQVHGSPEAAQTAQVTSGFPKESLQGNREHACAILEFHSYAFIPLAR